MKKIHLTKTDWNTTATYTFREDGVCVACELPEDVPAKYTKAFFQVATMSLPSVAVLPAKEKFIKVEEQIDLSFENAWAKYNYKQGKVKAKEAWAKLKDEDKIKALKFIPAYDRSLMGTGTAKLYFERYCKYKRWEDAL
jgi:hypothetical protein